MPLQVINKSMAGIVKSLDSALKSNNLEKVASTMDQVGGGQWGWGGGWVGLGAVRWGRWGQGSLDEGGLPCGLRGTPLPQCSAALPFVHSLPITVCAPPPDHTRVPAPVSWCAV